jgi:hypothetical protein
VNVHETCLLTSLNSIFVAAAKVNNEGFNFLHFAPEIHRTSTKDNYKCTEIFKDYGPRFTEIGI